MKIHKRMRTGVASNHRPHRDKTLCGKLYRDPKWNKKFPYNENAWLLVDYFWGNVDCKNCLKKMNIDIKTVRKTPTT